MKRNKNLLGTLFILLGTALIVSALVLVLRNSSEDMDARDAYSERLDLVKAEISDRVEQNAEAPTEALEDIIAAELEGKVDEMVVVEIDGEGYIGFFSSPAINLEMPVMAEWSEQKLKRALCRHFGSPEENNLVIAGHNYKSGFGKLRDLNVGDEVYFTDMNGKVRKYLVGEKEILDAEDTDRMIHSDWELSLYTCTYSGKQRITVRCRLVE